MRLLYNSIIIIVIIISPVIIIFRILNGKENLKSILEKFGFSKKRRNKGKLLWIHCSSVGEFLSIVPLFLMIVWFPAHSKDPQSPSESFQF